MSEDLPRSRATAIKRITVHFQDETTALIDWTRPDGYVVRLGLGWRRKSADKTVKFLPQNANGQRLRREALEATKQAWERRGGL